MSASPTPDAFAALLEQVHAIGRAYVAPYAEAVDRDARFPDEAFAALKAARLLSSYVPSEQGGMGLSFVQVARVCEVLGQYCGSTAMVFAMHQIQVACVVHHALGHAHWDAFVAELVERQLLLASATTEVGVGGDVRTSRCAVQVQGGRFALEKQAPVISYAEAADVVLVTARRAPDAGPNDQVHVVVRKGDLSLEPLSGWDTLGFRGTCSSGYVLRAEGDARWILPVPYAEIHARTMHPFSHIVWSSLWLGIAADAVQRARAFTRAEARKTPGLLPPGALRLAEVDAVLFTFRSSVHQVAAEYQGLLERHVGQPFPADFGFTLRLNNLKVSSSTLVVDVVGRALLVCGIQGYRNDSAYSLCRPLRDAYGAALMVNNDRILGQSATLQVVHRET